MVRVLNGYIHFNRIMTESLGGGRIDLFIDSDEGKILVKPGSDFVLTIGRSGRGTFSAGPFLRDYGIEEGFYPAHPSEQGLIFSIRGEDREETTIKVED